MRRRFLRTNSTAGFTLIELLVVIVILGILMAVAVPTFLRQQTKAQDSRTQQYLTTAYKAIRSGTPDTGNQYPSSTSMVSWVQQSEPELTVQRAGCYTGTATAPTDAVLVDPSSSANSLLLCARSASGNVWELSATATSAPTLINGTLVPLTFSGNEITDARRAVGTQGDGLSNDSSTGIWEGTTNLIPYGGFETSTQDWQAVNSTLTSSTEAAKFGSHSLKIVQNGGGGGYQGTRFYVYGLGFGWGVPVTASATYTASAWIDGGSGAIGQPIWIRIVEEDASGTSTGTYSTQATITGGWQRITVTHALTATAARAMVYIAGNPVVMTYYVDGVQLEQNAIPTPYVDTNGASASRGAARVQAPASLLNATQGWVSMRVRLGPDPGGSHTWRAFEWGDDINNRVVGNLSSGTQRQMQMYRIGGGVNAGSIDGPTFTWTQGAEHTFVFAWTANDLKVSLDGASFTHLGSGGSIPNLTSTLFDVGHSIFNGASWIDSDVLWLAGGVGALSDSDAASIGSIGDSDPSRASFPSSAQVTMTWDGTSSTGSLK